MSDEDLRAELERLKQENAAPRDALSVQEAWPSARQSRRAAA
jgi:hypothetical protein